MSLALKRQFPFIETESLTESLNRHREEYKYTPDIAELQAGKRWYIFEYGECMTEHREHEELVNARLIGNAFTSFGNLIMYKKDIGTYSFPIVMHKPPKKITKKEYIIRAEGEPGRIKGELFCVEGHKAILELDKLRENTVCFRRIRLPVLFPYVLSKWNERTGSWVHEERVQQIPAWIYIGLKTYWDNILDNGYSSHIVRRFHHNTARKEYATQNMGDYFYYSKLELIDDEDRNGGKIPL